MSVVNGFARTSVGTGLRACLGVVKKHHRMPQTLESSIRTVTPATEVALGATGLVGKRWWFAGIAVDETFVPAIARARLFHQEDGSTARRTEIDNCFFPPRRWGYFVIPPRRWGYFVIPLLTFLLLTFLTYY